MDILRIDGYSDERFSGTVLKQHGAYLISGEPYEIEITGSADAVVRGKDPSVYQDLIERFRFHAPHIVRFCDRTGKQIADYPSPKLLEIELDKIQPSQFFIDEEKLNAIRSFVRGAGDIVIQVISWNDRYISLDGHTRLYLAVQSGFRSVRAVTSEADDWVWDFVQEAQRRQIFQPKDMILLSHNQYDLQWNQYCDEFFAGKH